MLLEFPFIVAPVECAVAIQKLMAEQNADTVENRGILYRIGVSLDDVLIEGDDIAGDGVNIAARFEGIAEPGGNCLSGAAYDRVRGMIDARFVDLREKSPNNIVQPVRVYVVQAQLAKQVLVPPLRPKNPPRRACRWSSCPAPFMIQRAR